MCGVSGTRETLGGWRGGMMFYIPPMDGNCIGLGESRLSGVEDRRKREESWRNG